MVSIDVLRGITVAFMILVNTAGDGNASYMQLRHSVWNGCTFTDLVFPTFLFLMGVSMAFSSKHAGAPMHTRLLKATRRSAILILIGLALNALPFFDLGTLRYCGVMQRIGLTYWLAALLITILDTRALAAVCALLAAGYWALMTLVPVPGYGKSGLELGILNPQANLASALDRLIIPQAHLYHHSFYDPEGLLSTLPALVSVLFGVLAGRLLREQEITERFAAIAGCGVALAAAGLAWSTVFPFNKRMWTSSYMLWAAGIDLLLLAFFSWWLDKPTQPGHAMSKRRNLLTPWLAFGSNALAAYVLSEVLSVCIDTISVGNGLSLQRWSWLLVPAWMGSPALRSLLWSISFTAICYLPIYMLYRKHILIKL
jgi:predicted acyltransferase